MDVGVNAASPFSQRVLTLTRPWPNVTVQRADCGRGVALAFAGCQVAHLHGGDEAELLLGEKSVTRLSPALSEAGRVRIDERSIRLRLDGESDVRMVLSLLSVAIKTCSDHGCLGNGPWCRIARRAVVG